MESDKQEKINQEKQKNEYDKYVSNHIESYVLSLNEEEKKQLLNEFEQACDLYTLTKYKKHGLGNAIVKAIFHMFIKNKKVDNKLNILSLDEFICAGN